MEALQTQDTPVQIKPAKTEAGPEQGTANPSTKDFKAIISTTKEPSTASVPFTDQPMEVSLPQPSSMDVDGASFLESSPEELAQERTEGIFHRNPAETVNSSASSTSAEMYATTESKPDLSFPCLSSEEKPLKTSVERLAEMVSSPCHSSPLGRGTSPRELTQILPSLGDHSSVMPITTLIPLTPKIGMGKPAITKRKFSPGRPRVKQGAWSPHSSVSSPLSWSPDQLEGWDASKTRQSSGSPGWSIRVVNTEARRRRRGCSCRVSAPFTLVTRSPSGVERLFDGNRSRLEQLPKANGRAHGFRKWKRTMWLRWQKGLAGFAVALRDHGYRELNGLNIGRIRFD
ncbi:Histone-lysine N-methyltransferase 2C [Liparis tanakae]|uniref:Histone-lysine N-methyltransferase 2C n=1 Tax=Liparis tanakae TaxID=230148 RepID=A0A4Z2ENS1_9TELE|nr:Histone-lysine N-methyltransferase 2C [Liparis tanakae]